MRTEPVRMSRQAIDVYVTLDTRQTTQENTVHGHFPMIPS